MEKFKRFRDCPTCSLRIKWATVKAGGNCFSIHCNCGQPIGGWIKELPLKQRIICHMKMLLDKILYHTIFINGIPVKIKNLDRIVETGRSKGGIK